MRMLQTIRYCNECPFRKYDGSYAYYYCGLPNFLDIKRESALKLSNTNYSKPPDECLLKQDSVGIELEENHQIEIKTIVENKKEFSDKKETRLDTIE